MYNSNDKITVIKSNLNVLDILKLRGINPVNSNLIRCPYPDHEDKNPSFSIDPSKQFYNCFGCGRKGDQIDLYMNLFNMNFPTALDNIIQVFNLKINSKSSNRKRIEAVYPYYDTNNNLVYETIRFFPKGFSARRPARTEELELEYAINKQTKAPIENRTGKKYNVDKEGYVWTLNGVNEFVPFQLRLLLNNSNETVLVVGGEKDVLNLIELGFIATTNPLGEGNFQKDLIKYFDNKEVVIIPDCDKKGEKHLFDVYNKLSPVVKSIRYSELPYNKTSKKDISDFIEEQKKSSKAKTEIIDNINSLILNAKKITNNTSYSKISKKDIIPKEAVYKAGSSKLTSEFAFDIISIIAKQMTLFVYYENVVRIKKIERINHKGDLNHFTGFGEMNPINFITFVEKYIYPMKETNKGECYSSLNEAEAKRILNSEQISELPIIKGYSKIRLPYIKNKKLYFTKKGYDHNTNYYTDLFAPDIETIPVDQAKEILSSIYQEFCFLECDLDLSRTIAYLITPMVKLLFSEMRPMLFLADGNRPGVGKDLLLGLPIILYENQFPYYYSACSSDDEYKKVLFSACKNYERFLVFSNLKGFLNSSAIERYCTESLVKDRLLGTNTVKEYPNKTIIAISSNELQITEDIARRTLDIRLEYYEENIKSRNFKNKDLNFYVFEKRTNILAALYSLVNHWVSNGARLGASIASFQKWSQIVGGILTSSGYKDPFSERTIISESMQGKGDPTTSDMKCLMKELYKQHQGKEVAGKEIIKICDDFGFFSNISFLGRGGSNRLTGILRKYSNRKFGAYRFIINSTGKYKKFFVRKEDE